MSVHPFGTEKLRWDSGRFLMLLLCFVLSFALFYTLLQRPASDISIHATWAGECSLTDPRSFVHHVAHPLWHLMVHLTTLTGIPLDVASALVTALCKTIEMGLVHTLMSAALRDRLGRPAITLFTAVCGLVSCLCIPHYNPTVYLGVGTPNTWHSCTQLTVLVWMLLCLPLTAWCYDEFENRLAARCKEVRIPWKDSVCLGAALLLSLLAKPTFMQAFLPAACLYFLAQWIRHPHGSRFFIQIVLCVLPSVAFMVLQFLYYFGIIVPWQSGMEMQFSAGKLLNALTRVALMMAFPIYTIWMTRKQKKDTRYVLTLLFVAVAVIEYAILGESGRRAEDDNFGWSMMGASFMLWVECLIRFVRETAERRFSLRAAPGWLLLVWHFVSGVYYIVYLFVSGAAL